MNKENHEQGKNINTQQADALIKGLFYSFKCKLYYFRAYMKIRSALRSDSLPPLPMHQSLL